MASDAPNTSTRIFKAKNLHIHPVAQRKIVQAALKRIIRELI